MGYGHTLHEREMPYVLSENLPFWVHELPLTYERLQKCICVDQSPSSNRRDGYIRRLDGYYHRLDGPPNPSTAQVRNAAEKLSGRLRRQYATWGGRLRYHARILTQHRQSNTEKHLTSLHRGYIRSK